MTEIEKRWAKREIEKKLDDNAQKMRTNTFKMAVLVICAFLGPTAAYLNGYNPEETKTYLVILYAVVAIGFLLYIRNMVRGLKQRKAIKEELADFDKQDNIEPDNEDEKEMDS